ncbi:MAG: F0F1 ATP synthase subunit delta [Anaerolineae bacterium]|nr:F0F1 ATP synthase subunit delta [Anaerolineae bacterium]
MLQINWGRLLLQILNFAVMAFILWRFLFRSVIRILDERSDRVRSEMEEAERKRDEAEAQRAKLEEQMAAAEEQVIAMEQQAQEQIAQSRRQALNETRGEIAAMREKAETEIEDAHRQALYQHRQALGRLVTDLSARMVRDAATDDYQQASLQRFVDQLDALPDSRFQRPTTGEEEEAVAVQLVSARDLDPQTRVHIEGRIKQLVGRPVVVAYETDPALVAGATLRFADTVIDGSLSGRLEDLQARYVAELEQSGT